MAKYVTIVNRGEDMALVGGQYLFAGEKRQVLERDYETAKANYASLAVVEESPAKEALAATEGEAAEEGTTDEVKPGEGSKRKRGQHG